MNLELATEHLLDAIHIMDTEIGNSKEYNHAFLKVLEQTRRMLKKMKVKKGHVLHSYINYRRHLHQLHNTPNTVYPSSEPHPITTPNLQPGAVNTILGNNHMYAPPISGAFLNTGSTSSSPSSMEWSFDTDEFPPLGSGG